VVARVRDVSQVPETYKPANGNAVDFAAIPYFRGPMEFLRVARQAQHAVQSVVDPADAVILRIGSLVATLIEPGLHQTQHPYGVEVVGDPYEVFAPGVVRHPLRPFFRWWFTRVQKRQCAHACGAAYVTRETLQRRYPCQAHQVAMSDVEIDASNIQSRHPVLATHYSSVELADEDFSDHARMPLTTMRPTRLILVGSLEQLYKGPDVLIRALAQCLGAGLDLELTIVGDGKFRPALENLARHLGVAERVCFRGMLPSGEAVRAELEVADVFVLPSRTEGSPRALIEAMACALPCLGSAVGGIPELLPYEAMVPPGNVNALASKIKVLVSNPFWMAQMSARNLKIAQEYHQIVLRARRTKFYQHIRQRTEEWLGNRNA
jgi:glycosyltransferase involved in cell wall biosynthesis